jgi:hypothetical protein
MVESRRLMVQSITPNGIAVRAEPGLPAERLEQLQRDGCCVIPDVVDEAALEVTRRCAARAVAEQDAERLAMTRSPGTLIDSGGYPELADIVGNPRALHELERMGLTDVTFWKAVIISKFPGGPRLYWHQDCMMWQDPRAYSAIAPMIFLMYYLEDTSPFNGCLRVLPGSHRRRHPLHDIGKAHTSDINSIDDPDDPRFRDYDGATDVPVNAGDVVIGDARLLHAAHANRSDRQRTVITIWFYPLFSDLLEPTQRWFHDDMHRRHDVWPAQALAKIAPLIPRYAGSAAAMEVNRQPGPLLV